MIISRPRFSLREYFLRRTIETVSPSRDLAALRTLLILPSSRYELHYSKNSARNIHCDGSYLLFDGCSDVRGLCGNHMFRIPKDRFRVVDTLSICITGSKNMLLMLGLYGNLRCFDPFTGLETTSLLLSSSYRFGTLDWNTLGETFYARTTLTKSSNPFETSFYTLFLFRVQADILSPYAVLQCHVDMCSDKECQGVRVFHDMLVLFFRCHFVRCFSLFEILHAPCNTTSDGRVFPEPSHVLTLGRLSLLVPLFETKSYDHFLEFGGVPLAVITRPSPEEFCLTALRQRSSVSIMSSEGMLGQENMGFLDSHHNLLFHQEEALLTFVEWTCGSVSGCKTKLRKLMEVKCRRGQELHSSRRPRRIAFHNDFSFYDIQDTVIQAVDYDDDTELFAVVMQGCAHVYPVKCCEETPIPVHRIALNDYCEDWRHSVSGSRCFCRVYECRRDIP